MIQVKMRTKIGVAALRILANGEADLPNARAAQNGFALMPLSAYLREGLAHKSPAERPQMPLYAGTAPEDIRYFDELGDAMRKRLPASADAADELVASFAEIGLSVGNGFAWKTLDDPTKRGLARAAKIGEQIVDAKWAAAGEITNGWKYTFAGGRAGYDPGLRAALAKYELGEQLSDKCCIRTRAWTTKVNNSPASGNTFCISTLASCLQSRSSGIWRCMGPTCYLWRTTSDASPLAAPRMG